MTVDFNAKVKANLHRTWTLHVQSEGEISYILDPDIGQSVWSASHSGSLAVYRPTFSATSVKLHHENISNSRGGKFSNSIISHFPTRGRKPMKVSTEEFSVEMFIGDERFHLIPSEIQWAFCLRTLYTSM